MKKFAKMMIVAGLSMGFVTLTGCGTMAGVGKDIQSAGQTIESSAEKR